jgi:hypothetical protein
MNSGRIDVFVRGVGNRLYQKVWLSGKWTGWYDLGGGLADAPAAVDQASGRIDVFVRGTNNDVYQKVFDNGKWTGWYDLGGQINGRPATEFWPWVH